MLRLTLALLPLLSGCAGTFLAQSELGYGVGPREGGPRHSGDLALHIGMSDVQGVALGASIKARVWGGNDMSGPQFGPHVVLMVEEDKGYAFYTRLLGTLGPALIDGEPAGLVTASVSPGFLFYIDRETANAISVSTIAEVHAGSEAQVWFGLNVGIALGGIR